VVGAENFRGYGGTLCDSELVGFDTKCCAPIQNCSKILLGDLSSNTTKIIH
jgi:hypothetical protein